MSSRYAVNYQLRQHKRDQLIEFIKTLLLTLFVLRAPADQALGFAASGWALLDDAADAPDDVQNAAAKHNHLQDARNDDDVDAEADREHARRYADIMGHVERLIDDYRQHDAQGTAGHARLTQLVPALGKFFTRLPLRRAFLHENRRTRIAQRRHVPPSFNDIRRVLNQAQAGP